MMLAVFCVVAVIIVITAHEMAHGYMAYFMGDDTAKKNGRLSLNPLNHLDPIGFLTLLVFGFGWAKPVPIRARQFKNVRLGIILTSFAGPLMNFIIAFLSFIGVWAVILFGNGSQPLINLSTFLYIMASMSVGLGVFNLIPIPPLDGSKILGELLPMKLRYKYYSIEQYSRYILIGLILLSRWIDFLSPIVAFVESLLNTLALGVLQLFM